jgi:predicted Zn-ribbon and HTH transcriptional regulator
VHDFVTRDLYAAGRHLAMEERDIADWLRLDLLAIEKELLNRFSGLAQAAKFELKHLEKARKRFDEWHTGEVTTIGTLRCRHCGEHVHFERTARIPPCPKCHTSVFERVK